MEDREWFKASVSYWETQNASVHGMLGGFSSLHAPDIRHSKQFLTQSLPTGYHKALALDVGAGIGRVSQHLLLTMFKRVSILESDGRFVERAKTTLGSKLHRVYNCRLQEFHNDEAGVYDLVWVQWVLMYASDDEIVKFLTECYGCLRDGGLIGIKENTLSSDREAMVDLTDHSIVRSDEHFRRIFDKAGFRVINCALQANFPTTVYPVRMYLLSR